MSIGVDFSEIKPSEEKGIKLLVTRLVDAVSNKDEFSISILLTRIERLGYKVLVVKKEDSNE